MGGSKPPVNPNAYHHKGTRPRKGACAYKDREFIAWDGEGEGGKGEASTYILFGNSTGMDISSPKLRASECLALIVDTAKQNPSAIHVWFAGTYDVTMILASIPEVKRTELIKDGTILWKQYVIEFMPKKWFQVYDRDKGVRVKIFDIFTFFACSAMKAWEDYLGTDPRLAEVKRGKDARDTFSYADLPAIRRYMHLELELYVELVTQLRRLLSELDVHPTGWYGPGAVSGAVMKKFGVKNAMDKELPREIVEASQHAYFGGRFEQFKTGLYVGDVYSYDVRSAYPHALRMVPNLAKGFWVYHDGPEDSQARVPLAGKVHEQYAGVSGFSLWHLRYRSRVDTATRIVQPHPLPYRDKRFTVHYPPNVEGWYWGPEARQALRTNGDEIDVLGIWEFCEEDKNDRPFAFLADLYDQRAQWKREGNRVQHAAKLILNSIYGKLAQRVGWNEEKFTSPTWHQLEWAGFATAMCRAMIAEAIAQKPDSVVAVETDGIYTTEALEFPEDKGRLGDWESEQYDGIMYVQSGVYWLSQNGEWNKVRIRGFSGGDVSRESVLEHLPTLEPLHASTRRFAAITGFHNKDSMTQWLEAHPRIEWGGGGKRIHDEGCCGVCIRRSAGNDGDSEALRVDVENSLHTLRVHYPHGGFSTKHVLPWLDAEANPYWEEGVRDGGHSRKNRDVVQTGMRAPQAVSGLPAPVGVGSVLS